MRRSYYPEREVVDSRRRNAAVQAAGFGGILPPMSRAGCPRACQHRCWRYAAGV
jgi:hypothetical protein